MPDISIAYRLLLESGQQVNIYDWMMAFNTVVNSKTADEDHNDDIPADIQYVLKGNFFFLIFYYY